MTEYYVYALGPQDFGWEAFLAADDWLERGDPLLLDEGSNSEVKRTLLRTAEAGARGHPYWGDGKMRGDGWPRVSALPSGGEDALVFFTWKLDNNGTTIVASPVRLPWLDAHDRPLRVTFSPADDGKHDY